MDYSRNIKNNIFLFYVVRTFFLPFFWLPVLYIYFTKVKGLGISETMFLLGLQELLMIFLEIPTGVVADKVSRKFSVGLGYVLTALPFLFLPLTNSYWLFILIFFVKAVGKALVSGADTSLLYDTLVDLNLKDEYKKIISRSKVGMMLCASICIASGGWIAQSNIVLTLILPFPLMMIGALAAFLMVEPDESKNAKLLQESNYLNHIKKSGRYILNSKTLIVFTLLFSISEALAVNLKWIYTPIFEALNMNLTLIGGVTALLYLAKSAMAYVSVKLFSKNTQKNIFTGMALIVLMLIIIIIGFKFYIVVGALLIIILAGEILETSIEEGIHIRLESHNRATVMSVINLASSVVATIMINGFGISMNQSGLNGGLLFLTIMFVVGVAVSTQIKVKAETT